MRKRIDVLVGQRRGTPGSRGVSVCVDCEYCDFGIQNMQLQCRRARANGKNSCREALVQLTDETVAATDRIQARMPRSSGYRQGFGCRYLSRLDSETVPVSGFYGCAVDDEHQ